MTLFKTALITIICAAACLVWSCADSTAEESDTDDHTSTDPAANGGADTSVDSVSDAGTASVTGTAADADSESSSDATPDTNTAPEDTGDGADTGNATAECNGTAIEGLAEGDLVPNVQLQRCDGTAVSIQELICGVGKMTQVYSFAWWCPDCAEFLGIGDSENPYLSANTLYEDFHEDGYELLIVLNATESPTDNLPTAADCVALEELVVGTVVFDSTGTKTQEALDLKINGGTALASSDGTWVVPPAGKDVASEDVGTSDVISTVADDCGCD